MSSNKHTKKSGHKRPDRRTLKKVARKHARQSEESPAKNNNNEVRKHSVWDDALPQPRVSSGDILREIDRAKNRSMGMKPLAHALNVTSSSEVREMQHRIKRLVHKGELAQRGNVLHSSASYVAGVLHVHPDGFGFVNVDGRSDDVYMANDEIKGLIHGDEIEVALQKYRGRESGRFVTLLHAAPSEMIARIEQAGNIILANPRSRRFPRSILVNAADARQAQHGDWVRLLFDRYSDPLRGKVLEVLGRSMDVEALIDIVQGEHQLPEAFPDGVLREARGCAPDIDIRQHQNRNDLTHLPFVTIDGEDARDFDDAICVIPRGEGFELWVAIADVAHYVAVGSHLDVEAKQRGNSYYLPDRVIPMLPESLSNGLCSLNPHVVRLAMVVRMRIDASGRCRAVRISESLIRSRARLTYAQVTRWLEDGDTNGIDEHHVQNMLSDAASLTRMLLQRRELRGALDLDLPESTIVVTKGSVTAMIRSERNIAHRLIEEMMLATNIAVAEELEKAQRVFLYRTHPAPEMAAINRLNEFLAPLGLPIPMPRKGVGFRPADLQRILFLADQQPWGHVLHRLMLRSMQQASYATNNKGHFGLAYHCYCHFTSPIRRYADLTIHRQIKALITQQNDPYASNEDALSTIGSHISRQERTAQRAEWDTRDMLAALYHRRHLGEVKTAVISGISKRRVFFELLETLAEASIALESLPGNFDLDERRHCLRSPRGIVLFSLGDTVHVRIESCEPVLGQINVALVIDS
ncbi:MAG: ribonuclease R [Mariprofundaceae bacterium]|nr:ribonuclease R [Mariprofundaceae bacterium]